MCVEPSATSRALFLVLVFLAATTSVAAFSKHTGHPVLLTAMYATAITLTGVWLARGGLALLQVRQRQRAVAVSLTLCAALALVNVVMYPMTRRTAAHSSAPDALIDSATRLVAGEHPYAKTLFDGAAISPGPGWIALHAPLTTNGLIWAVVPLHMALAAILISGHGLAAATAFPLSLLLLPAFLQMSLIGHDFFAVGCAMVTVTLATYDTIAARVRAQLVTSGRRRATLALMVCALVAALVASARAPFAIFLPTLGLLALMRDRRSGATFIAVSGGALVAMHAGFYLWGDALGLFYHPLHVFGRAGGGAGLVAIAIGVLLTIGVAAWLWTRGIATASDWLLFMWATTGLPFVAVGFGELITVNHLDWANWEGKIYAGFALPLLITGLLLRHAQAHDGLSKS